MARGINGRWCGHGVLMGKAPTLSRRPIRYCAGSGQPAHRAVGDELPDELADPRSRIARLRECKQRLDREAQEARDAQQRKIDKREADEESGPPKRVRKPLPAEAAGK